MSKIMKFALKYIGFPVVFFVVGYKLGKFAERIKEKISDFQDAAKQENKPKDHFQNQADKTKEMREEFKE